ATLCSRSSRRGFPTSCARTRRSPGSAATSSPCSRRGHRRMLRNSRSVSMPRCTRPSPFMTFRSRSVPASASPRIRSMVMTWTGLIKPLSRHVLATALRQCSAWQAEGIQLHVAVNLTIPDLLDLELPDLIRDLLEENGVTADRLELEITESTILADPFRVRQV